MDSVSNQFDYDTFPATGTISAITPGPFVTNDWEPEARLDHQRLAGDPLTATFSDLDLAPAREHLLTSAEFDASYWAD